MSTQAQPPSSGAALPDPARLLRRDEIDPGTSYVPPGTPLEARLAGIWQQVLTIDKVGRSDDFFELGGDSLQAVELFVRVEKEWGVVLSPSTIIDHPTVARLAALLAGDAQPYAGRSLVPLQMQGAEPPLFLVHELGGNLLCYRELLGRLGTRRKVYGLQHPGQNQDPIPAFSIPHMAAIYVDAITQVQARGPYHVAGFSFGGAVAYEIARQLRERGDEIGLLALIDAGNRDALVRGAQKLARKLSQHLDRLSEERPSRWPHYLLYALRKDAKSRKALGDLPPEVPTIVDLPDRLRNLMYDTLLSAHADYPAPPFDGEIKLFRTNNPDKRWHRRSLGWADRAKGGIEIIDITGDHGSVLGEPAVVLVAEYLVRWLEQSDRRRSDRTPALKHGI